MIWKTGNRTIEYKTGKTLIMGIVNVTPDSFSDGGLWSNSDDAIAHALDLEQDGADILDFGAQSTRPGYIEISADEEWSRLEPVLKVVRAKTDLPISVDTYFVSVARRAIELGVDIINDVSGVINPDMAELIASTGAGWVIMHNGDGGVSEVSDFFDYALCECKKYGIDAGQLCFDMGIGFGKSYEQNLELIANVDRYLVDGCPILLGTSRKRVIATASQQSEPSQRVYGNISADTIAIFGGADIIRLHDVKNEKQGIMTADALLKHRIKD